MSDLKHLRVEWDGELAVVTVDRQEKLNALNSEVVRELGLVLESFARMIRYGGSSSLVLAKRLSWRARTSELWPGWIHSPASR